MFIEANIKSSGWCVTLLLAHGTVQLILTIHDCTYFDFEFFSSSSPFMTPHSHDHGGVGGSSSWCEAMWAFKFCPDWIATNYPELVLDLVVARSHLLLDFLTANKQVNCLVRWYIAILRSESVSHWYIILQFSFYIILTSLQMLIQFLHHFSGCLRMFVAPVLHDCYAPETKANPLLSPCSPRPKQQSLPRLRLLLDRHKKSYFLTTSLYSNWGNHNCRDSTCRRLTGQWDFRIERNSSSETGDLSTFCFCRCRMRTKLGGIVTAWLYFIIRAERLLSSLCVCWGLSMAYTSCGCMHGSPTNWYWVNLACDCWNVTRSPLLSILYRGKGY